MTEFTTSENQPRVGHRSLNVKPMSVRLPEGVPERIDELVGKHRRAQFIRDAVLKELELREADVVSEQPTTSGKC